MSVKFKILLLIPALLFSAFVALVPVKTFAAFDAGYVFPDPVLTAKDTMSEAEIQAFLIKKGSFLANYSMPAGMGGVGWNNDIDVTGWSAAKVIYSAAQWYGVNPQLIIITLQKEQSSITYKTQGWAGQTDWATGYGVPDGSDADPHYKGFAKQVDMATWQFRWVFEGSGGNTGWYSPLPYGGSMWDIGKTVSCPTGIWETWDGVNIGPCVTTTITSRVASALYKHNPYRVNKVGLYNIYYNWFDFNTVITDSIKVTVPLTLSNNSPAIGEAVTATATVKNVSTSPITLQYLGIVNYFGQYERNYGGGQVTLAAGDVLPLTSYPSRILPDIGKYKSWVSICYGDQWLTATDTANQPAIIEYSTHIPKMQIVGYIDLSPTNPTAGQAVIATASIRNLEPKSIKLDYMGIVNELNPTTQNYKNYGGGPITIGPGSAILLRYTRTLTDSGNYRTWIAYAAGNYWFSIDNSFKGYVVR